MSLFEFFNVTCSIVFVLYIWFDTTAFFDYSKLLGIRCLYEGYESAPPNLTYTQYLFLHRVRLSKNNPLLIFLLKLITCPICTCVWVSLIACSVTGEPWYTPIQFCLSLTLYTFIHKYTN